MAASRPPLRHDIEGLRGVAILLVVLFHAGVPGLAGGFVGVDVFFVLSGYFITGLLARELAATGGVSLTEFYGRRALRLLPVLLVVLFTTLALVMLLYAPVDRALVARNARAVALMSANVEFAGGAVNYFSSGDNPFLHTWSLAVEEQFYLVWPLLFLVVALAAEARRAARDVPRDGVEAASGEDVLPRRALLLGITVVGVLSFLASVHMTEIAPPWAFFGMPTRVWEFALGGALAVVLHGRTGPTPYVGGILQLAGAAIIAVALASYTRATPYPGSAALLPAFGATLLLAGGQGAPESVVSRLLGARWLGGLGRLSYAWYLWHWPLVGLGAELDRDIGVPGRLAWSGVALVLAWLTHRYIETPARDGRLSRMSPQLLPVAALGASVVAALLAQGAMVVAEHRMARPDQRAIAVARGDRMPHECWARTVEDAKPCEFGDRSARTTIVLLGDSHAEHWLGGLDRVGRERGWKIVAMVKGGCPVADIPGIERARMGRHYRECTRYRAAMLRRIVAMRPTAVILSSWDHYVARDGAADEWQVTPDDWHRGLRRTYTALAMAGIPTVAIRGTPRTWFDVPTCLSRRAAGLPFSPSCDYDRDGAMLRHAIAAQTRAAQGLPTRFLDMNDRICATARCSPVLDGTVVFTDDNHLTASFTRSLAPVLGPRLQAAMLEAGARVP